MGRPPSPDVPLTIMTRKDPLIKQGGNEKSIDKLLQGDNECQKQKRLRVNSTTTKSGQPMKVTHSSRD